MSTRVDLARPDGTVLWSTHPGTIDAGEVVDARTRPLTEPEKAAVAVVALAVAVLGVVGLVNSFFNVSEALRPTFGRYAESAALGIDLGIAVFAALGVVLARLDMHIAWLRLIPWGLTAATIYLNVAGEPDWTGRIAHAVLASLWVVAAEVGIYAIRLRAGLMSGRRMDTIRFTRWLLAPLPTLLLWRRMVLWEIRSYPEALRRERDRVLARTRLQDTYGLLWRWKAPRRERALYRLGELAPDSVAVEITTPDTASETAPAELPPARLTSTPPKRGTSRRSTRKTVRKTRTPAPDVSDLIPAAESAATAIAERGETVTARTLAAQLRADGHQVGNGKLTALLDHLRSQGDQTGGQAA